MKRNGLIDFYRFLFAQVIVLHHSMWIYNTEGASTIFRGGYSAVEFFFILSGYLLTKKAYSLSCDDSMGDKTWNEIFKRVKALYPAFILAYAVAVIARSYYSGEVVYRIVSRSLGEVFLLLGAGFYESGYVIIGPIWYLSDLLIIILLAFPLMVKYKNRFCTIIAPLTAIFGYAYLDMGWHNVSLSVESIGIICGGLLRAACGVALGSIAYYLTSKRELLDIEKHKYLIVLVNMMLLVSVLYFMNNSYGDYHDFIQIILFSILIVIAFRYRKETIFNNRVSEILGEYSGILYVTHYALLQFPLTNWINQERMITIGWLLGANLFAIIVYLIIKIIKKYIIKPCLLSRNA